ncbi:MAG: phage antirepressor KilAC domain-containing protein [Gammaproteobacteria bacterium]|nr:phage antirepressor KilAC domain-containing protein [Gammaproteobacteria bacterium]
MTNMILTNNELTMSHIDIAELVGSRADSVKRTVDRLAEKGVIQLPPLVDVKNSKNQLVKEYRINKRDSYVVVAQLSPEFTAKLVDRWQELESKQATPQLPDFTNPAIAARAWADEVEAKQKAIATIKEKDKLIVAVADLNIRAGDVSVSEFAKNLAIKGLGRNNLFRWLKARGYLMANTEPYQPYVDRGYFVRKPYEEKVNGEVKYKTMLTPRGCAWLSKILHAEFELNGQEVA